MNTKPIELVLSKIEGLKPVGDSGRQWIGFCPGHDDKKPSFSVGVKDNGNVVMCCYTGCANEDIVAKVGLQMRDLFLVPEEKLSGITLGQLAFYKRLNPNWLKLCGLRQIAGRNAIEIPYKDEQGVELFARIREQRRAKDGTRQPPGVKLRPYGLWKLDEFRSKGEKCLILVEGESDCWRLWFHGFAALGIPGADAVKTLQADSVAGFEAVMIWSEPDTGGDHFAKGMTARLAELGYPGLVKIHKATKEAKDPSDIGAALDDEFADKFREILSGAPVANEAGEVPTTPGRVPPCVADAGFDKSPFPWGCHPFTDQGNARRIVHLYGDDMLYVDRWDRWYIWDGIRWKNDETLAVHRFAMRAIHGIWWEGQQAPSRTAANTTERWWLGSQSAGRHASAISLARAMAPTEYTQFDQNPDLFNASNGTIDLRTGVMRAPNRDERLTAKSPVKFDPAAKCPAWLRTMDQVFTSDPENPYASPDEELLEFVHRLFGCCLTGRTPAILPIFWGAGANGKSLVINVVSRVLGYDYSMSAPPGFVTTSSNERHPTEIADLYGKRAVFAMETDEGQHLNASLMKRLTGSDPLRARRMREDLWEFLPTHKLILCTNHRPRVSGDDPAIWRRLALVPFKCVFWNPNRSDEKGPEHRRQDPNLLDKLLEEKEGILAWLVKGAVSYLRDGLAMPKVVSDQTREYRDSEDLIGQFLTERTKKLNVARTPKSSLYEAYRKWADADGYRPVSAKKFGQAMMSKGYDEQLSGSTRYWLGIDLDHTHEHMKDIEGHDGDGFD